MYAGINFTLNEPGRPICVACHICLSGIIPLKVYCSHTTW